MATRCYLPTSTIGAAAVSPAFDSSWEGTASAVRRPLTTGVRGANAGNEDSAQISGSGTDPNDQLVVQFVSSPITAATAALLVTGGGTIKGQARVREDVGGVNGRAQMLGNVVSGDGTTVRGALFTHATGALSSEFAVAAGTLTNRKFPLAAVSPVTLSAVASAVAGDRIVIEIGARIHGTNTTGIFVMTFRDADTNGDLPEDETATSATNPWVEFSQNYVFVTTSNPLLMGVG